jgi:two-component system invasion response regulator UvrY
MKVLLVDDHAVVREGVRRLLTVHFDPVVIEAGSVESGLELYEREKPDIVLLDLNLGGLGGLEMLRRVLLSDEQAKVLIFTMHAEPVYAMQAMRAGARGYVSKSAPVDELVAAIRKVLEGGQYIDRDVASRLALSQIGSQDPLKNLSLREVEILRLLGQGKSLTAIADTLGVAYKTVANTCSNIKAKLGVERTADLIRLAVETLRA